MVERGGAGVGGEERRRGQMKLAEAVFHATLPAGA